MSESRDFRVGRDYRADARRADEPPWPTNCTDSVGPADGADAADDADRTVPLPGEVASEFFEEYPHLASLPITHQNDRKVREILLEPDVETGHVEPEREWEDGFEVAYENGRNPVTWGEALVRLLQDHDRMRDMVLHFERGEPGDPCYASFETDAENRFMASYQHRYYAKLKGWFRETMGVGERPSGNTPEGTMTDPKLVLLTRSASSVPDGRRMAPVDHFDALRESWSDVYNALRNQMKRLGYDDDDWQYDRRVEPHTGERGAGQNLCYPHEHVVIVVDGDVSPGDLRPVVQSHVDSCDQAGPSAHDLDVEDWDRNRDDVKTVSISDPEELNNVAAYVADYAAIEPCDLLERSVEYVAFAAAAWATDTRTITRSDAAGWASQADACRQRFEDAECEQDHDHGEAIVREDVRGEPTLVCAACKTPHGIDQSETLTAARLDSSGGSVAADGGVDVEAQLETEMWNLWQTARGGARVAATQDEMAAIRKAREAAERRPEAVRSTLVAEVVARSEQREVVRRVRERSPETSRAAVVVQCQKGHGLHPAEAAFLDAMIAGDVTLEDLPDHAYHREHPQKRAELAVDCVLADYDLENCSISIERPPKWRLEAVEVDGELHSVDGDAGGVDLRETELSGSALTEWIMRETVLSEFYGKRVRYGRVNLSMRSAASEVAEIAGASVERAHAVIEQKVMLITSGERAPDPSEVPDLLRYNEEFPETADRPW